ncbi:DNA polymerase epsilon catalytic subunit A [Golovinomyces cichoracearum]|uniref:DNA polymerase epsilon catalytic subunit n=1 Tax=Golovinomyces cichoracearum TaxID=62708 RepID=A0A420ICW0_9PEZI|nr:DNA polymerase epsilon catalytic subunit A [Golovinomyces cichoracearum]
MPQVGYGRGGKQAYYGQKNLKNFSASKFPESTSINDKRDAVNLADRIDEANGFVRYDSGKKKVGWLVNIKATSIEDEQVPEGRAAVDCYLIEENGETFKATVLYEPYFLVAIKRGYETEAEEWLKRMPGGGVVKSLKKIEKEDLKMPNHLLGYKRVFFELRFSSVGDLLAARKDIMPVVERNKKMISTMDLYAEVASANTNFDLYQDDFSEQRSRVSAADASDLIVDIREWDVPYHVRVMIDLGIRTGKWYSVEVKNGLTSMTCIEDRLQRADPVVMAYDIETTKLPLKFPDASIDQVMMISYMIDGQGFLITNREIVAKDIDDFEYTPKPEYEGPFITFNEPDEKSVLERFFLHIKESRPTVIATYNGDFFDWPFVDARASINGIDMYQEIGWRKGQDDQYCCDYSAHMDCFHWVNRDSYLPQGSRGLKAVTTTKLGYDPDELDPELMLRYASERPQVLAEYSVSDAVATYYLYMKYVHPFIFSLCTIIPLGPDAVLRKGTGTLCEMLLMVQAYEKGIVLPNKHTSPKESFWEGHLLESETYVGGHVESIEAGVFRADIPVEFSVDSRAIDELLQDLDAALKFSIEVEEKKFLDDVVNYDEVKQQITDCLNSLKSTLKQSECPLIYHLDVASMYPNIMTTNRLQPDSMIDESNCAACDFNRPGKTCDRRLPWSWRGEFLPAKRDEYNMIRNSLEGERFPGKFSNSPHRLFQDLTPTERADLVRKRLQIYSQKIYHRIRETKTIEREAIICQRENPFYIDTVRAFRDRRYDYKGKQKEWKGKTEALKASGASSLEVENANKMIVLFDSLQLAHKVILNSFYGYVMRKGSRWYSMEMAGVTCLTGAHIIQMARQLIERIGRPLELDTDGIWCMLPATFPENYSFNLKNGKKLAISYPCVMLNHLVHGKFTNHQYQTLVDSRSFKYETHSENSIFFEVDGPYRAMVLPTSKEEDKNLKKRYAVFNHDGSLAELKGFELKRRGELKLIKIFQQQIFKFFLEGKTLAETYGAVAKVANQWLDVLYSKGETLTDDELIDLICENRSMSKPLDQYGTQKSTSITTAKRLADFLGEQMVKDKGLNCKYVICSRPRNAPVTERAIPIAIFSADPVARNTYLSRWMKETPPSMDPKSLIDWEYYLERLGSVIQKLITIPAALQKIRNPVPRVSHPEWLQRKLNINDDKLKQRKMTDHFKESVNSKLNNHQARVRDMEDIGAKLLGPKTIGTALSQASQKQLKRKSPEPLVSVSINPYASLPEKMPDPTRDYRKFLDYQKQKWKIQKQQRTRRRHLFGETRVVAQSNIGTKLRNQAEIIFRSTWQVLQIRETTTAGMVLAFILIDSKIHQLKINVPRQIYLNLKERELPEIEVDGCMAQKVVNILPNGHASVHLFKLTMSEEIYLKEAQRLSLLFSHPSVEGVYEKQVPPNVRAVLQLGCLCTMDETKSGVLGKGLEAGFDISGLKNVNTKTPYLSKSPVAYLYLYHVVSKDKQIFALFSTVGELAYITVLQDKRDANLDFPNISKIYSQAIAKKTQEDDTDASQKVFEFQDQIQFKISQVTTRRKALLEIGDLVKKIKKNETNPLLFVIQSPQRRSIVHEIPILNEFPLLSLNYVTSEGNLPPLGWQSFIARRLVNHYLSLNSWILHLTELARYGDIPLCNLERDDPRYLIDVAYARRLQKNNVVLWWSAGPRPDHAGYEKDDVLGPLENVQMPSINTPGTYSSVCIDVELKNLAINTILTSSLVNELEGSSLTPLSSATSSTDTLSDGSSILYSDKSFASAGITVLREMVKAWWAEACKGSNMADIMVQHLVRWVENPDSFLYDRSLHYYVQLMSLRAFRQLMADFRRVGCHIIFANSNRLLLQTTKSEVGNAYAFSQYILKSIKAKPHFYFLDLEITEYWDFLAWYDEFNYGGKACNKVVESEKQALNCVMHWQLSKFLPISLQSIFHDWVVEFVEIMHKWKLSQLAEGGNSFASSLFIRDLGEDTEGKIVLGKDFEKPLKRQIAGLIRRQKDEMLHPELASDYAFPSLPGSYLELSNPVLELVKSLMQVILLDKNIAMEARLIRKELLALFEIREFSAEARFENPSQSLKLVQVICDNCTMSRDFDFCRDEDLIPESGKNKNPSRPWKCSFCNEEYNRLEIEERLIGMVYGICTEWYGQDLKCVRCGTLRVNDFMEHCACSGSWGETISRDKSVQQLHIFDRVAKAYSLKMLDAVMSGILSGL